jgi:predicted transposase YdaD
LNKIQANQNLPQDLIILKDFLSIKDSDNLQTFVTTHDTDFSRTLVTAYMHAIHDDSTLIQVEGSEKFMIKLTEAMLLEERQEGEAEGIAKGKAEGEAKGKEETIRLAIQTGIPAALIEKLAMKASITKERLSELFQMENAAS